VLCLVAARIGELRLLLQLLHWSTLGLCLVKGNIDGLADPTPLPPRGDSSIAAASQQQLHRSSSITAAAAYDMSSQQIRFGNLRFLLIVLRRATLLKGSELR
jgi:hypothetical protein